MAQQLGALSALPLTTRAGIARNRLTWHGQITPTALSKTYTVRLTYSRGLRAPAVHIVHPQLRTEDIDELPHIFDGDELCLCYPEEWSPRMMIAWTVIPWASEWLLYFELFKATGRWHGGGHEPAVAPR